jgi:hypothetical protein
MDLASETETGLPVMLYFPGHKTDSDEITSVLADGSHSERVNSPLSLVVVPEVEFLTVTDAPATGAFTSSKTFPVMVLFWAIETPAHRSKKGISPPLRSFFIRQVFGFKSKK